MIELEKVKAYLRVTTTEEDDLISDMIQAAINSLEHRTGKKFVVGDPAWEMTVKLFVAHLYDNRGAVSFTGTPTKIPDTLDMWITDLALRNKGRTVS